MDCSRSDVSVFDAVFRFLSVYVISAYVPCLALFVRGRAGCRRLLLLLLLLWSRPCDGSIALQ